ncbi:MAG: hypothetical protein LIP16_15480 [Clostridium sp.]|nr:hypothetical protein [Clostridium sp.]
MAGKKEPGKFTIKFNVMDPAHRQVIDTLEPMGRTKAQFIANAVLHYLHCSQTPDIPQPASADYSAVEAMVRRILAEHLPELAAHPPAKQQGSQKKLRKSEDIRLEDAEAILGEDGMAAIADTLFAFRGK